jgi:hypothetical protein
VAVAASEPRRRFRRVNRSGFVAAGPKTVAGAAFEAVIEAVLEAVLEAMLRLMV